MIIGVGFHAKRIYLPVLFKLTKNHPLNVRIGIDLQSKKNDIQEYLETKKFDLTMIYLEDFDITQGMPPKNKQILSKIVKDNNIDGVIISTEPLAHKEYALWAISQNLNVLMDKPISTRKGAAHDTNAARGIHEDYKEILKAYLKLQEKKETVFSINAQRRYELGYLKTFDLIKEVVDKFNAPVTSIQAMHSDGVWIFPNEVVDQKYHPYNLGFGKGSHSGYHIFDIVWQFYMNGLIKDKAPDCIEVYSSFLNPDGLLTQFSQNDYNKYFGDAIYQKYKKRGDSTLFNIYKGYGEIDVFSILRLVKKDINICNISLSLLHNSFSRRAWFNPNSDLYKGNGRVKHQYYCIQQGPFQCIQIHNFQSNDIHDTNTLEDYTLGGNNHFDIYVFRNSEMFGKGEKPLRVYNLKDLDKKSELQDNTLYNETTKEAVLVEFLNYLQGLAKLSSMRSNITSHEIPSRIMSSVYESNVRFEKGNNPIVTFKI